MERVPIPWNDTVQEYQRGHSQYVVKALKQPLLLPKHIDSVRKLKQQDLFMSLKRDPTLDNFCIKEEETLGAQVVHLSNAKYKPDRQSGVHAPILVIAHPDRSFEEEEDKMALNKRNKSLKDLMATRNKGSTSQEVPKSQVPPTLPPLPPPLPTDLGLRANLNLKKKMPVQELEEGEVPT